MLLIDKLGEQTCSYKMDSRLTGPGTIPGPFFVSPQTYTASAAVLKTLAGLNFTAWRSGIIFVVPVPLRLSTDFRGGPGKPLKDPEPEKVYSTGQMHCSPSLTDGGRLLSWSWPGC